MVDMRWVKPLDEAVKASADAKMVVTVEEHQRMGGAGSAVGEYFADQGLAVNLLSLGLPDRYEAHAKPEAMLARVGLDGEWYWERQLKNDLAKFSDLLSKLIKRGWRFESLSNSDCAG